MLGVTSGLSALSGLELSAWVSKKLARQTGQSEIKGPPCLEKTCIGSSFADQVWPSKDLLQLPWSVRHPDASKIYLVQHGESLT